MDESGDDSMSEQQHLEANRKVTRARYRKLMDKIADNQEALAGQDLPAPDNVSPDKSSHCLMQFICENNDIFQKVDAPQEASMDAVVIRNLSKMCRQRAENMTTNINQFRMEEFALKIKVNMGCEENAPMTRRKWVQLGNIP